MKRGNGGRKNGTSPKDPFGGNREHGFRSPFSLFRVPIKKECTMLRNYLKSTFRNLRRFKLYSVINIAGLAVGLAVFIVIMHFVQFQMSFDDFNKKADRIYRVVFKGLTAGGSQQAAITPELLAPALKEEFPQIKSAVRIEKDYPAPLISYGAKRFYEDKFLLADSTFFRVFNFKFLQGDGQNALTSLNSVVITHSVAEKYFGLEDPIGKIITVDNGFQKRELTVTGVIEDVPPNSSIQFDFLASLMPSRDTYWFMMRAYTYILLKKGYSIKDLTKEFPAFIDKYVHSPFLKGPASKTYVLQLQPLLSIHLNSDFTSELQPPGDIRYVEIFSIIGLLILLIACVNYTNLSTSRYLRKITEMGVRKSIGAGRRTLILQILVESVVFSFISLLVSLVLVELLSRLLIGYFPGIQMPALTYGDDYLLFAFLFVLAVITGILSGGYPAFYLSRLQPTQMLRRSVNRLPVTFNMRRILIVFQFVIATVAVLAVIVLFDQLRFIENTRLGFNKENVIVVHDNSFALSRNYDAFKNSLLESPYVVSVSSGDVPGVPGSLLYPIKHDGELVRLRVVDADFDYLKTLGVRIEEGRGFTSLVDTSSVLINETCARALGLKNPIGADFGKYSSKYMPFGRVVGVVRDFHITSLRETIPPILIRLKPGEHANVMIRVRANSVPQALAVIKADWNTSVNSRPIQYSFLSDDLNQLYTSDQKLAGLFSIFAFVGIFIACLGLFGLSALVAEQRTKEVGIRKALGASVSNIVSLLSKEFLSLVLISNLFAWPIAYIALNRWLQGFAYRVNLGVWLFVLAGVMVLVVSMITVSFQAIRTATANPVESLRYE